MNRRLVGRRAQKKGSGFEIAFEAICKAQKIGCVRIPDGCKKVFGGFGGFPKLKQVKSPFDFILAFNGRCCALDVKSYAQKRFCYSNINPNQVKQLNKIYQKDVSAGYLVFFSRQGYFCFFNAEKLGALKPRESLGIEDADISMRSDALDLTALFGD